MGKGVGLMGLALLLACCATPAAADHVRASEAALPTASHGHGAADVGSVTYLAGGWSSDGPIDRIVRYDSATGAVETLPVRLPARLAEPGAAVHGDLMFLFGGMKQGAHVTASADIIVFRPERQQVAKLQETLPDTRSGIAAASDGQAIFLFGGLTTEVFPEPAQEYQDQILRFDPVLGELQVEPVSLPSPRSHSIAVWDGQAFLIFGGREEGGLLSEIVRYSPANGAVSVLAQGLPEGRAEMAAAMSAGKVHLLGGTGSNGTTLEYDVASGRVAPRGSLPSELRGASTTIRDGIVHVLGGADAAGPSQSILLHDPAAAFGPQAAWSIGPTVPTAGQPIHFLDSSQSHGPGLAHWRWSFGDGSASMDQHPVHTYAMPGSYEVTLEVESSDGMVDFRLQAIGVTAAPAPSEPDNASAQPAGNQEQASGQEPTTEPVAVSLVVSDESPLAGQEIWFNVTGSASNWTWSFGDGAEAEGASVSHAYQQPGYYAATVTGTLGHRHGSQSILVTVIEQQAGDGDQGWDVHEVDAEGVTLNDGARTEAAPVPVGPMALVALGVAAVVGRLCRGRRG